MAKSFAQLDGLDADILFGGHLGLTFDDFIILPGYIDFTRKDISLRTQFTRNISLAYPFVSSPMDTVTESEMAIALSLLGAIGILHYNNAIDDQVRMAHRVKRYENGFIVDPIVLSPRHTIAHVDEVKQEFGFTGVPITEDGTLNGRVMGIVTNRRH